jgi:hypothetical protein
VQRHFSVSDRCRAASIRSATRGLTYSWRSAAARTAAASSPSHDLRVGCARVACRSSLGWSCRSCRGRARAHADFRRGHDASRFEGLCLGDHLDALLCAQQQPQAVPQQGMVLSEHDTNRRGWRELVSGERTAAKCRSVILASYAANRRTPSVQRTWPTVANTACLLHGRCSCVPASVPRASTGGHSRQCATSCWRG